MIWLAGQWYDERSLPDEKALSSAGEQAQAALAFVRAWLRREEAFEIRTSGSTGAPKPIRLTRGQMEASAQATAAALGLEAGMNALVCLPVQYIAGRMMLVRGLVLGLNLVIVEPSSDPLAALPASLSIDFASFVPLQMKTLLDIALLTDGDSDRLEPAQRSLLYRRRLEAMRAILVGGGPVSPGLEAQIRQIAAPVYHTYGMTETATHVALRRLNGPHASDRFIPLPGVETGVDERGCLSVRGPMTGGILLQTNDRVALLPDGSFIWMGRWDHVINSGGVKVHGEQVEAVIEALAAERPELGLAQRRFFVAGLPDERLGQQVVLIVEGPALAADQEAQLRQLLIQALPRHHAPRQIQYVARFAETPTGKIERSSTLKMLG